ncbi:cell division protein ZapB [Treponema zuelzerae]|uniref:Cell division protein ZapB n=1 Tax=Teretinema zuelzerae TaxID=156 RepID=A0AAE3EGV3_9SPIR|nr:cell division protein ZapB [Teretinema zuelzerae]MCD1653269.1 cell division protein ZapB [Teretinema zuelzerae]
MLNLDQVRLLENRVEKAVDKIQSLTSENQQLKGQLSGLQSRVLELEGLVNAFKNDQGRIEEGILNALDRLSAFEDSLYSDGETVVETGSEQTLTEETIGEEQQSEPIETFNESGTDILEEEQNSELEESIQADWNDVSVSADEDSMKSPGPDGQMDIF